MVTPSAVLARGHFFRFLSRLVVTPAARLGTWSLLPLSVSARVHSCCLPQHVVTPSVCLSTWSLLSASARSYSCWLPQHVVTPAVCLSTWSPILLSQHVVTHPTVSARGHPSPCLSTRPQPLPQPVLHTVQSSASSFNSHHPPFSSRPSISRLRLLPRIPFYPSHPAPYTVGTGSYLGVKQPGRGFDYPPHLGLPDLL